IINKTYTISSSKTHSVSDNTTIPSPPSDILSHPQDPISTQKSTSKRRYSILSPSLSPMTTKKTTRSSSSSSTLIKQSLTAPSAKHKPPVSSPLAVTSLIKRATTSSEIKRKNNHMTDIQDTADNSKNVLPPVIQSAAAPDIISSFSPTIELNEFNMPDFLLMFQRTLREHSEKFKEYDGIIAKMNRLQKELDQTKVELDQTKAKLAAADLRYQELLRSTSSQLIIDPPNQASDYSDDFPKLSNEQPPRGTADSIHAPTATYASRAAAYAPQKTRRSNKPGITRKRQVIARHFQPPSDKQGFTYLYMPCRSRSRHNETRKALSKLGLPSSRILDISYPTSGRIGILVHNDYIEEATSILTTFGISLIADFDPTTSDVVKDPKYNSYSDTERRSITENIHHDRLLKVLNRLHLPISLAVAKSFVKQAWITQAEYDNFHTAKVPPKPDSTIDGNDKSDTNMSDLAANFQEPVTLDSDQLMDQADGISANTV
ncbi:hypothetical protein BDB01DRAFT_868492, partial [Pilobolus umbonatus]